MGKTGAAAMPGGAQVPAKSSAWPVVIAALIVVATALGLAVLISRAAAKPTTYAQASPEDLVKSAVGMIRNGEASRLVELFYAETPEGAAILKRTGDLLGAMQRLGTAVAKRFPDDIAKLREETLKKTQANAAGVLSAVQVRPGGTGGGAGPGVSATAARRPPSQADQQQFQDFAKALFADPFGWIDRNADRLSAVTISDDRAAVLFDGKPLPPVGLPLKLVNNRWYIDVPLDLPQVKQFLPQVRHEYSILGNMLKVLENVINELADDVNANKIGRVDLLAEKAGEKAVGPALMVFIVYGKEMDVRNRRERAMNEYRKKVDVWIDARGTELKEKLGPDWYTKLVGAFEKIAMEELDALVRVDTTRPNRDAPRAVPAFKDQTIAQFEQTLEQWATGRGGAITLAAPTREQVEAVIRASVGVVRKKGKGK